MENFQQPKKHHPAHYDLPATHHKLTSKNHVLHTTFRKNPCKNGPPPAGEKITPAAPASGQKPVQYSSPRSSCSRSASASARSPQPSRGSPRPCAPAPQSTPAPTSQAPALPDQT